MSRPWAARTIGEGGGSKARWWGSFPMDEGEVLRWRIGPMTLWIARTEREWRVTHERTGDPFEPALAVAEPAGGGEDPGPDACRLRFGFRKTAGLCRVLPALPDRALVVRPEEPFHLPSGEEITLYVSAPLWFGIHVGDPPTLLYEAPVFRPSDTWFGPPSEQGACCYASRTRARASIENVPLLAQRAVAVVSVRNHAESQLALERLRLPSTNLSLFATSDGRLWTERVSLERKDDGQSASLDLDTRPPGEIGNSELIVGPREPAQRGLLMRTFGDLL